MSILTWFTNARSFFLNKKFGSKSLISLSVRVLKSAPPISLSARRCLQLCMRNACNATFWRENQKRWFEQWTVINATFREKSMSMLRKTRKFDMQAQSCCKVCVNFTFYRLKYHCFVWVKLRANYWEMHATQRFGAKTKKAKMNREP